MSFFKRLFGLESEYERMARELFSPEGDQRRDREQRETEYAIDAALNDPAIQQIARETGLREQHIRDVHSRLMLQGDPALAARAIRNPELLRWFYNNGGKDMKLGPDQAIQLVIFAQKGHL